MHVEREAGAPPAVGGTKRSLDEDVSAAVTARLAQLVDSMVLVIAKVNDSSLLLGPSNSFLSPLAGQGQ